LANFSSIKSLFELVDIQTELEDVIGKPVDLVLQKNLKERIRPYMYKDLTPLYGKR